MFSDQHDSSDKDKDLSTRVNSARLADYVGKHIRLPCKALKLDGERITVEASDGGQVTVQVASNADITDTYIEVIGRVTDSTTVQMLACVNLGSDLDMKLVNDTIELIHDPRFYAKMFC
ncbi:replication factor A protein 3 [Flammula alnicola]|nr:replication factor A protein 3 [Flammula alnicola]